MCSNKIVNACVDYMLSNGIKPSSWKITEKSLVWYDFNQKRTIVPLTVIMGVQ